MFKRVLLVGPMPNDVASGVSAGFESLVDAMRASKLHVSLVDTAPQSGATKSGAFRFARVFESIVIVLKAWFATPRTEVIYMTIASSQLGFLRDMLIILWASLLGKRIVLHLKGGGYPKFYESQPLWCRKIVSATLEKSSCIVVLGKLLRDQFAFVPGIDEKLRVVPNGVPKGLDVPSSITKVLPGDGKPLRLLYLSNLIPSKGYLTVLEACRQLSALSGYNFVCDFCGAFAQTIVDDHSMHAKESEFSFLSLIDEYGLADRVHYHGTVSGKLKEQLLTDAHVFLLPTRYPWEGQPISIIEALAFATPIISTNYKGIPELVNDGQNGFLVPPDRPDALVEAILRATASSPQYISMSLSARKLYESQFTRETHIRRLISVICDHEMTDDDVTLRVRGNNHHGM